MNSADWRSTLKHALSLYLKSCLGEEIFSNLKDSKLHIHATGSLWSTSISRNTLDLSNVVVKVTELIFTTYYRRLKKLFYSQKSMS